MSLNSKVILSFLAGTFSALLAWVLIDFNGVYTLSSEVTVTSFRELYAQQAHVGGIFGMFVGLGIGFVTGWSSQSVRILKRDLFWGAIAGLFGGLAGLFFGQLFYSVLRVDPMSGSLFTGPLVFVRNVFARAVGWSLIGMFLGVAQGLPSKSVKTAKHGAVGGFIGGLLGGTLFEVVPYILPVFPERSSAPGIIVRGIGLTVTGASIGFFIGLVETLLKQAWVRVVQGRNEGREYIISKARTTIGRDELSDVGLFGDRNISPLHAAIEVSNGRHVLRDAGSSIGTFVNGRQVAEHILRDGDIIAIGSMKLEFHEKATASKIAGPVDVPRQAPQIPTMAGICPFCGSKKDPSGACACSISAPPGDIAASVPNYQPAAVPASDGPRLVGTKGPYAGQVFPLPPSGATIGREPGRDIQLPMDTTVSRRHARIANDGGAYVVFDEGSSNGTSVNGMRITSQPIVPGDVIEFGSSGFRFEQ